MKKTNFVSALVIMIVLTTALLFALTVSVFLASQRALAQGGSNSSSNRSATTQSQPSTPPDQNAQSHSTDATSVMTFSGKIVKSGSKYVLADTATNTIYQLDDQQKAQDFLHKNVKVTGSLDASTGTIWVSAIGPA